jgi:hypothetical protein
MTQATPELYDPVEWERAGRGSELQFFATDAEVKEWLGQPPRTVRYLAPGPLAPDFLGRRSTRSSSDRSYTIGARSRSAHGPPSRVHQGSPSLVDVRPARPQADLVDPRKFVRNRVASASAPYRPKRYAHLTAVQRILLALALGRQGRALDKLGKHGRRAADLAGTR